MNELKHCPFCGGKKVEARQSYCLVSGHRYWYLYHKETPVPCVLTDLGCGVWKSSEKYTTEEKAIAAWNRRVGDDLMERMEDDGR